MRKIYFVILLCVSCAEMVTILLVGFLVGMQHALEPDHLAAVASLATRGRSIPQVIRQGTAWGLGHGLTLLVFAGLVLLLDGDVPASAARTLELAVAFLLILLGADVLRRLWRHRLRTHDPREGAIDHLVAPDRTDSVDESPGSHRHSHAPSLPPRALLVGVMHGLAGSATLLMLTLTTVATPLQGFLYVLIFGTGSVVGMATLAALISLPLHYSAGSLPWAHKGLQLIIGAAAITVGALMAFRIAA